ncbi:hypothetical protein ACKWTF_002323 [Chironomus riparius]
MYCDRYNTVFLIYFIFKMEKKCLVCEKTTSLKVLDDQEFRICEQINEMFSIKLNEYIMAKSMICKRCISSLRISFKFFQKIQNARDRLKLINTVLIKIEVKEEISESHKTEEEYSIVQPFSSPFSWKENEESEKEITEHKVFLINEEQKTKRKYNKIPPELRKKNRGIRRAKEALTITTKLLYQNEMIGKYCDSPETLEILDEDKLDGGKISSRVLQLFSSNSWPTFDWICHECPEHNKFSHILELNEHLHKIHKNKFKRNCYDCNKSIPHFAAYLNHIIENHSSHNKFCCILCSEPEYRWNFKDLYLHYQRKHLSSKVNFCIYCGLHFICGAKLKEHLISKHKRENDEGEKFQCDFCGWKTELRHRMKNHMVKHVTESTFMCDQCTLIFASAAYLSTHIKQVHSRLEINCSKCGKLFKSERRLRVHDKAVHQNNKQFKCHICQKAFHAQYRLNSHLRIHADALEEKYQCSYCERRFKYKPGERPFFCPIEGCNERFLDYSNARKHISGTHNSMLKPFKK